MFFSGELNLATQNMNSRKKEKKALGHVIKSCHSNLLPGATRRREQLAETFCHVSNWVMSRGRATVESQPQSVHSFVYLPLPAATINAAEKWTDQVPLEPSPVRPSFRPKYTICFVLWQSALICCCVFVIVVTKGEQLCSNVATPNGAEDSRTHRALCA